MITPKRVCNKCPAIILAVNRTVRAPGRILLLIVSVPTVKDISTAGAPWGVKWANICCVLLIHPNVNLKIEIKLMLVLKLNN